jgi:hypothetical protein
MSASRSKVRVALAISGLLGVTLLVYAVSTPAGPAWTKAAAAYSAIALGFALPSVARQRWQIRLFGVFKPIVAITPEQLRRMRWTLRSLLVIYGLGLFAWLSGRVPPMHLSAEARTERAGVLTSAILGIPAGIFIVAISLFGDGVLRENPLSTSHEEKRRSGNRL